MHELPVAVVGLGEAAPAVEPGGPAATGDVDAAPVEFPLVTAAQRAGECDRLGLPWERGDPVRVPVLASAPVDSVIAARGSQRRMDPSRGLHQDLLRTCMGVAVRGLRLPHWVVVHDVAGLPPGVYRWPALDAPVRAGELRPSCTGYAWARTWPATPPSSPSPRLAWTGSATGSTVRRTWPPGWPKAACTWPPTRWAPAPPG